MELNRTDCGECKITITPIIYAHSDPFYNCTFEAFIGKNLCYKLSINVAKILP